MNNDEFFTLYETEINQCDHLYAGAYTRIAHHLARCIKQHHLDVALLCDGLFQREDIASFSVATTLWKHFSCSQERTYLPLIEQWALCYIDSWYACDQFCYRVLNPAIEAFPCFYPIVLTWKQYAKVYVHRAIAVSLLHSSTQFCVRQPFAYVYEACEVLKEEMHPHIQKGMGWLLKYAYLRYPKEVAAYLIQHIEQLSSTTFSYALEKMPKETREELRNMRKLRGS